MRFVLLMFLLSCLSACEYFFIPSPYALPEATETGANTAGFRIGDQVIIPMANAFSSRPAELGHSLQSYKIWLHISCYNERRNMKYKFSLELIDSLYDDGVFLANKGCDSYSFSQTFCVKLEDNEAGITYYGSPNHRFELNLNRFELGQWEFNPYVFSDGDTFYTHSRSVLAAGTFSGVLTSSRGELITVDDGRFDLSSTESNRFFPNVGQ